MEKVRTSPPVTLRHIEIGFGDGVLRCWPIRRSQAEAIAKAAVRRFGGADRD